MKQIDIYLVDDHALFREGLKFLLSGLDFIGSIYEAENGQDFLDGLQAHPVALALIDIEMPVVNGVDAARTALELCPDLKIIALSMYSDEGYYTSMIDAGAHGFLLKNSNFAEVNRAIEDVYAGKNYFSLEILQAILRGQRSKARLQPGQQLTEREVEVLVHICEGMSNVQIADCLCLSKRTVDKHRENLLLKTQSKNTAGLVIYAIKNGHYRI
jgi:DNA-binding NarL/FixJ family response regulator